MAELSELAARGVLMGVAGSVCTDIWSFVLRRQFGIPTLDYALLGRWIGHMPSGAFTHDRIAAAPQVRGERLLGWATHYAIGVTFAIVLLAIAGLDWARQPTIWPPLAIGIGTIAAPWFVMQPAMGAGVAGSRTPNPPATRLRNLGTHVVYGVGLFVGAATLSAVVG
jgi:hypothetical protein